MDGGGCNGRKQQSRAEVLLLKRQSEREDKEKFRESGSSWAAGGGP